MKMRTFIEALKAEYGEELRSFHLYTETYWYRGNPNARVLWKLSLYCDNAYHYFHGTSLDDLLRQACSGGDPTVAVDSAFEL